MEYCDDDEDDEDSALEMQQKVEEILPSLSLLVMMMHGGVNADGMSVVVVLEDVDVTKLDSMLL